MIKQIGQLSLQLKRGKLELFSCARAIQDCSTECTWKCSSWHYV